MNEPLGEDELRRALRLEAHEIPARIDVAAIVRLGEVERATRSGRAASAALAASVALSGAAVAQAAIGSDPLGSAIETLARVAPALDAASVSPSAVPLAIFVAALIAIAREVDERRRTHVHAS